MSTRSEAPRHFRDIPRREKLTLGVVFACCLIVTVVLIMSSPRTQHIALNFLFMVITISLTIVSGARAMIVKRAGKTLLAVMHSILAFLFFLLSFAAFGWVCNAVDSPV